MNRLDFKNLSTPYDYYSIMHFPEGYGAVDSEKPTMTALKRPFKIRPGLILSEIDVEEIRILYNCETDKKGS